ncbi:HAD-like domain-containing protein [Blyttiomyces helicus]|uniref:HAD-like domain-containing protein n=1 Tax=Blyttiomyces helicus TaxID=388810 RepID=A0A4P9WEA7_9FUNG|nr:HAD-like domain-containing protein [Blyttiomyces helicus]|eukprot:RKO90105.1 HAD-like domain-containing protein [Blyttiomyces helicus]
MSVMPPLPEHFNKDNVKLIATDVDGTLLSPHHTLTTRTINTLKALHSLRPDLRIVFATGRAPSGVHALENGGLSFLPHSLGVFLNGSVVLADVDDLGFAPAPGAPPHLVKDGKAVVLQKLMPVPLALRIIELAEEMGWTWVIYSYNDIIWHSDPASEGKWDAGTHLFAKIGEPTPLIEPLSSIRARVQSGDLGVSKIVVVGPPSVVDDVVRVLPTRIAETFPDKNEKPALARNIPEAVEVIIPRTTKATALAFVAERMGIDLAKVLAFGDAQNDVEMISECGMPVAMGNAQAPVKKAALSAGGFVTATNGEDGVAYVLEQLFGLNEASH